MDREREITVFGCTLIGCVADIIAILVAVISGRSSVLFFVVALVMLIGVIVYLWMKLNERINFIDFVEHLFNNTTHNFTLLPKACLAMDKSKEKSDLCARDLCIKYSCDLSAVDPKGLNEDTDISYGDVVEYSFTVENKKIPEEFVCYLGNMYADDPVEITQKHGSQEKYEIVPPPRCTDEKRVDSAVQRYSWQIKNENITHGTVLPISFRMRYEARGKARDSSTFVFYPKQYAKRIDNVTFKVEFNCKRKVLQKVELFKVCRTSNGYRHIPISGGGILGNSAEIEVHPDATKNEAYYLKIYWDLL